MNYNSQFWDARMVIVLMGVTGSGKTTVGTGLAEELGWDFYDADDFHPLANKTKMAAGIPLNDEDRVPWLEALGEMVHAKLEADKPAVLACSALKENYRRIICRGDKRVKFIHLDGTRDLISDRLSQRKGHFMNPALLESQFQTLEPPADAVYVDVTPAPAVIIESIKRELNL